MCQCTCKEQVKVKNSIYLNLLLTFIISITLSLHISSLNKLLNNDDVVKEELIITDKNNLPIKAYQIYFNKAGIAPRGNTQKYAKVIVDTFPEHDRVNALKIVMCESSFIYKNVNKNRDGTKDYGLFQINSGRTLKGLKGTPKQALDPYWNIKAAYKLYKDRGWKPWVCAKKVVKYKNSEKNIHKKAKKNSKKA